MASVVSSARPAHARGRRPVRPFHGPLGSSFRGYGELIPDPDGILDLPKEQVNGFPTTELQQKAARPLLGGLKIDKLRATLPDVTMRSAAQGIADWKAATA